MTAVLQPREQHARPPAGGQRRSAIDRVVVTPLFTRHMLGAIEADRDRRRVFRETNPRRRRANAMAHPRMAAAVAANARRVSQAHVHESRWGDEGGRFDPDAAARLRNSQGDEAMQFVIYPDNSAQFHWRLMGDDGTKLAVSAAIFTSAEDARRAAADVHDHAGAATGTDH